MDRLPNELLLQVISHLEPRDVLSVQLTNSRYLKVGRDSNLWKCICFEHSRAEEARRRQQLFNRQEAHLMNLRQAIDASTTAWLRGLANEKRVQEFRSLASWDPAYQSEKINYYQEYIHRHARTSLEWISNEKTTQDQSGPESIGMGIFNDPADADSQKLLTPLEDGRIRIYDLGLLQASGIRRVTFVAETSAGYLLNDGSSRKSPQHSRNETEATDSVSIDSSQCKAYVASFNTVSELDLSTLQIIRRQAFPFPVTALSAAQHPIPLTVGTHQTLHLYDPRAEASELHFQTTPSAARCELIGGAAAHAYTPVTLSQPGPLSILHSPSGLNTDSSIYIAGRFTSLLHYDRRFWPRIAGTIFSGARLSALAAIPHPYIPRSLDLMRNADASISALNAAKAATGVTLIAAGEYKGKGSLELYGLESNADSACRAEDSSYRNRQTAAKSRLLSVAPHGTRIVFSDGDGNLKWVERDGGSVVRNFNINTDGPAAVTAADDYEIAGHDAQLEAARQVSSHSGGIFGTQDDAKSDIVRKILPRMVGRDLQYEADEFPLYRDDLIIQTGDGKLGMIAFGGRGAEDMDGGALHQTALNAEEAAKERQERVYGQRMREALERSADEARWVRDLGLGFRSFQ